MESTRWVAGYLVCLALVPLAVMAGDPMLVLRGQDATEVAPHGTGNVYAPHVLRDGERLRMWYGGQGRDGHDRIHLAESDDGRHWVKRGVVLDRGNANHVNDPSVVKVGATHFLYYTQADEGVIDDIRVATSDDGVHWTPRGVAIERGAKGAWDDAIVGRPSVLVEENGFRLWYDGRSSGERSVGHAVSKDGIHWTKSPREPVRGLLAGAGAVDIHRTKDRYVLAYESREGTRLATSPDGLVWNDKGLWIERSGGAADRHGHVTPHLYFEPGGGVARLFFGAASRTTWDGNSIHAIELSPDQQAFLTD